MTVIKLSPLFSWLKHLPLWLAKTVLILMAVIMVIPLTLVLAAISLFYIVTDFIDALKADGYE